MGAHKQQKIKEEEQSFVPEGYEGSRAMAPQETANMAERELRQHEIAEFVNKEKIDTRRFVEPTVIKREHKKLFLGVPFWIVDVQENVSKVENEDGEFGSFLTMTIVLQYDRSLWILNDSGTKIRQQLGTKLAEITPKNAVEVPDGLRDASYDHDKYGHVETYALSGRFSEDEMRDITKKARAAAQQARA
jgi:hypothetical protein